MHLLRCFASRSTGLALGWIGVLVLCAAAPQASAEGADGDFDQRTSTHFVLHQDVAIDEAGGFHGSRRFEQLVLDELERAYDALDRWFALRPRRKLDVVIYDAARFDAEFSGLFRFPAAGFYQGVIRVRGATRLDESMARVLHHELLHAALDAAAPSLVFPGWVNEGAAEWFEWRSAGRRGMSAGERAALRRLSGQGALFPLSALSVPAFGRLGPRNAAIAYLQSHALIDYLVRHHGERKLAQFYAELIRSRHLERSLRRVYRLDSETLEARFRSELG